MLASGSIGKLGSMFMVNLKMIDVTTAKITAVVSQDIKGAIEDVVSYLPSIAQKLIDPSAKPAAPAPPASNTGISLSDEAQAKAPSGKSKSERYLKSGFRFGIAGGWNGSIPRSGWKRDIDWYMDGTAFGNGVSGALEFHLKDTDIPKGTGLVGVPIIAIILEFDYFFSGHFDETIYTSGGWETELSHRFFNASGAVRFYPLKFTRAWTPFLEYGAGFHHSSFPAEPGDDNNYGTTFIDDDEPGSTVSDGNGLIQKISIGHDLRFSSSVGVTVRTTFTIGSAGILEPLGETWMFPDYYSQNLRSLDIKIQLYWLAP